MKASRLSYHLCAGAPLRVGGRDYHRAFKSADYHIADVKTPGLSLRDETLSGSTRYDQYNQYYAVASSSCGARMETYTAGPVGIDDCGAVATTTPPTLVEDL